MKREKLILLHQNKKRGESRGKNVTLELEIYVQQNEMKGQKQGGERHVRTVTHIKPINLSK